MGKHLDFYINSIYDLKMPVNGLCEAAKRKLIEKKILNKFIPTNADYIQLKNDDLIPGNNLNDTFWACGLNIGESNRAFTFTPLRQTIILFMAAVNNEL